MLVVTLLTVMLAAAFILVSADYRTTLNTFATARSLAVAQAGMQTYFSVPHVLTGTSDSATYTFSGGYARVLAQRLRDSDPPNAHPIALWVVRSIGYDTVRALAGQPNGQRAVAQFATLTTVSLPARAAMVAPNGVQLLGGGSPTAALSGTDLGSQCSCTSPGTGSNALSVTSGLLSPNTPPLPWEQIPTQRAALDSTHIDWASLLAGNFTPDSTLTPGSTAGWPAGGSCIYRTWYVPGDAVIPAIPGGPYGSGIRGLLVVKGNVTVSDGAHWDGVIVAGGSLKGATSSANYLIHGMVVTGLSLLSPGTDPGRNSVATQVPLSSGYAAHIQWTWCYTMGAIGSLFYLVPVKNSWVDTWSTY
jgi:hypothetical protein